MHLTMYLYSSHKITFQQHRVAISYRIFHGNVLFQLPMNALMIFAFHQETDHEHRERLRGEILGLTNVLSIVERQLGEPLPHNPTDKKNTTVDDILIHIAILLNAGSPSNLAVAVSGSQRSIMDMTLVVVAKGEGPATSSATEAQSAYRISSPFFYLIHDERYVGENEVRCTSSSSYPFYNQAESMLYFQYSFDPIAMEELTYKRNVRFTRRTSQFIEHR